jgi:hypothetical protein
MAVKWGAEVPIQTRAPETVASAPPASSALAAVHPGSPRRYPALDRGDLRNRRLVPRTSACGRRFADESRMRPLYREFPRTPS